MSERNLLILVGVLLLWLEAPLFAADTKSGETERGSGKGSEQKKDAHGRTFFWTEINLVGFYSPGSGDFDFSPRPQRTSAGFEYAGQLSRNHVTKALFGDALQRADFDIHPLVIFNPVDDRLKFVFHDAWLRLGLGDRRRSSIKAGHFLIPFGQNPILEPRGFFILPLTAADLGFKRDWGVAFQSSLGDYSYEVALTAASGLGFHHRSGGYLLSGRIGTPTYRDFEYGLSMLYGKVPEIRAERLLPGAPVSRWRLGGDMIYKYGNYTLFKGEVAGGKDSEAPVLGYQLEVDYVFPRFQRAEARIQFGSWFNDLRQSRSDDTFLLPGLSFSLTTATTLSFHYLQDLRRTSRSSDSRIFLQLHFYR
ncbi:MAG: hypothetical protein ACE5JX_15520 [Acidobacteriota bacterium]